MTFLAWAVSMESDKKKLFIHFQKMLFVFKQNISEVFFLRLPGNFLLQCLTAWGSEPMEVKGPINKWLQ